MQNSRAGKILLHILGSLAFLSIPVLSSPDFEKYGNLFFIAPFLRDFFTYTLLLLFFYLCYYIFIPKYYFPKKYFSFIIIIVFSYFIISFLPFVFIDHHIFNNHFKPPVDFHRPPRGSHFFIRGLIFQFLQFAMVFLLSLILKINDRLKQSEKEKLNAELLYLKAQINPHFLFNTLNSIYSLAIEKSDNTADAVVKLSGMMRYVITYAEKEQVSLEKEINYITDYVDLQKIRLDNTAQIEYNVTGNYQEKSIAPLLLIPFVENAFKYGINPEKESVVKINIDISDGEIILSVINKKVIDQNKNEPSSRLGIKNTASRLNLLYAKKHILEIDDSTSVYSVKLKITL